MKIKEKHNLRKPTGPYIVGCTYLTYEYNPDENDDHKRMIPCLCFYPAKGIGEGELKKYVSESILPGTSGIVTNSYMNAPIGDGKHPLLLFSHGLGLFCEANTVQFEELASHGYIVLSIGHPGGGLYELPNSGILMLDMEKLDADLKADDEKAMNILPDYTTWVTHGAGKTANIKEHREYYNRIIDHLPGRVAHTEIWIKDSLVALDMVLNEAEQGSSMLYNRVDKENVGAFGMSFGGSTALNLTHYSDIIKASANLDGLYYSPIWQEPIKKPIMLLQKDVRQLLTFPFLNAESNAYLVTVKNSTHMNFTDYNELLAENYISKTTVWNKEVELAMLGEINPDRMESILNILLLDFFNKYLKGVDSQVIDKDDDLSEDVIVNRKGVLRNDKI
ncbi:alpha/beta hydrolase family protein [Paenibacillus beijingensis]|uniref:Platelet-activating factor acetylhydrolase n=1 Tax=Paenibacillus beijingensis TaxID=1126833 RepID=A0A0D5NNC7_9BACL|nr:hypothetical protein [Paenibacillus beijingensis]AJY76809.1 hypothetical protein VN24_22375 [Paenibacillus beijingensis]